MISTSDMHPPAISRTQQYKKITKPLLERKRRARINRCLDELKELMVGALEAEGENISKLEKADILELTVRHLHRLQRPRNSVEDAQRYQAGFGQCAAEACQFLLSLPGVDTRVGQNLIKHLGACISSNGPLSIQVPNLNRLSYSPPVSPLTPAATNLTPVKQIKTVNTSVQHTTAAPTTPPSQLNNNYNNQEILSSTPSVQDLSKPLTGLLMQVPKIQNSNANNRVTSSEALITITRQRNITRNTILEHVKSKSKSLTTAVLQQNLQQRPNVIVDGRREKLLTERNCSDDNDDDEEEIDIEKVEEDDNMWRPW